MIRGIHHIALHTRKFDAMIRFYHDAFGFEPLESEMRWEASEVGDATMGVNNAAGRLVLLKSENCCIELFEFSSPPSRNAGPAQPNDYGYTHFAVEVTDIEKEFERLKGLGMTFTAKQPLDLGFVKSVYGKDPDGNVIELQQYAESDPRAFSRLGCYSEKR